MGNGSVKQLRKTSKTKKEQSILSGWVGFFWEL